jgi:glyoxylase-like metal-dependent hydrolase (beta-lactamase superfamily II)
MQISDSIYFYPFTSTSENNCNTVVVDGPVKIIIDPGHKHLWPRLKHKIVEDGLNPDDFSLVLFTHCHPDHMEAGEILELEHGVTQGMGRVEKEFYDGPGLKFFPWMGLDIPTGCIDRLFPEGPLDLGDKVFNLYLTPGHTPGSLCIHYPQAGILITGDLIFARSYGRTDFDGGDQAKLSESIKKMQNLEGLEMVLPGHGPSIIGADLVAENFRQVMRRLGE